MADPANGFAERLGNLAGKWTGYAALGTFLLYLFGYLALRFQAYAYGVSTNLDAFDEKYLFAGCNFLLSLVLQVPSLLTLLVFFAVVLLPIYGVWRIIPSSLRSRLRALVSRWLRRPYQPRLAVCLLALLFIQFVLRQCILLSNLLLRDRLPDFWIGYMLMGKDKEVYFAGLVLGVGLSVAALAYALRTPASGVLSALLTALLVFLVAVEVLLLPVNFGILINSEYLPRVSQIENQAKLPSGSSAWLAWESKEALTYLVCERGSRTMISIPKKENRVSIVGYDRIFQAMGQPPCSASK